jgi:outer membrane receptor protein involved in Fe transport
VRDHNFWGGGYAGAWFEHRYDTTGRKLSLTFNGNLWSSDGDNERWRRYSTIASKNFDRKGSSFYFGPSASIGANYTLPLKNNFEMEMGVEMGYSHNVTEQGLDSLAGTTWNNMGLRSYRAEGNGWSPEAYVTVQKRWGGFTAKLGLRAESTIMSGTLKHNSDVTALEIDTAFFGLVPSIHLSYQTQNFTSYSLSYTLRFSDPSDLADLTNLFRIYDDYSYSTGNPNLLRAYTHNFEAAWNKYLMGFGNIGLNAYVRANTNERGTMTSTDTDPNIGTYLVNYSYPVNIGMSHTEGIEANITYRPTGFFNIRFNASVFNYGYDYDGDKDSRVSWSARVNLWAKLWEKLEVFANARYTSPRLGLYSLSNAQKSIDFGVSSDFFDRQLSLFLNVNDIFGWSEWGSNTTAPSYQTTGSTRFNSRFVSVGLTWRIGKMELESKARQGATDTPQM